MIPRSAAAAHLDPAARKMAATQDVAAQFAFNKTKPGEHGEAEAGLPIGEEGAAIVVGRSRFVAG